MVLSKFRQIRNIFTAQYIKFLTFLFRGGRGVKISQNMAESFAETLEKFHELKISTQPQH